jgi:hypothetical protein
MGPVTDLRCPWMGKSPQELVGSNQNVPNPTLYGMFPVMHDAFGALFIALPAVGLLALVSGVVGLRRPVDAGRRATRWLAILSCLGLVIPTIFAVLGESDTFERVLTLVVLWSLSMPLILVGVGLTLLSKSRAAPRRPAWKAAAWALISLGALWGLATGYVVTHLGNRFCC